jgi:hypothetical protein
MSRPPYHPEQRRVRMSSSPEPGCPNQVDAILEDHLVDNNIVSEFQCVMVGAKLQEADGIYVARAFREAPYDRRRCVVTIVYLKETVNGQ